MSRLQPVTERRPRAVIYLRQSAHRDDSISLELQELACRDYCDRMGYDVIDVRSDPGISGRTWRLRPEVQKVMAAVETGTADVIILWKWSRLSRSRKDWALAADRVDVAGGRIESATEPIDTATASGRFARGVMTEYAAFQSEQIGEVWEEVRQRRLRQGLPASGRVPFGWRWSDGKIESNTETAPYVVEMYRRYLGGSGAGSIARWLNDERVPAPNGGTWSRARPLTVMDSPIHVGLIPYRGETFPGEHEPLIDSDTWAAYQAERGRRAERRERPRPSDYLLSTLMICTCGHRMSGKGAVTGGRWYGGYICNQNAVEHTARRYVSALRIHPLVEQWVMEFDAELPVGGRNQHAVRAHLDRILRDLNDLENELAGLARQNARGIISDATMRRASAETNEEIARLRLEEQTVSRQMMSVPTVEQVQGIRLTWASMSLQAKNTGLRRLISSVRLGERGAILHTTWGNSVALDA